MKQYYVLRSKGNGKFVGREAGLARSNLKNAMVFTSRRLAREEKLQSFTSDGRPYREEVVEVLLNKERLPYITLRIVR